MRTVIVSFVGFALLSIDLGLPWWGQALVNATTTLFYPQEWRDQATVVLFTEDDLAKHVKPEQEPPFPIPYRLHAEVIKAIAYARPSAIFIDFAFLQKNLTDVAGYKALKDAVCDARHRLVRIGKPDFIKVFILDTSQLGVPGASAETFDGCAIPVGAFIDREKLAVGVMTYPKSGNSPEDTNARVVTKSSNAHCACEHGECGVGLSAAYALWLATRPCNPGEDVRLPEGDRMAVIWPALSPPSDTMLELCRKPPGLWERFLLLLREGPQALKRACPYNRTFTADDVLPPIKDNDLDKYLHNHVVFYGAKLALAGDVVRSPVFSEQPAIYYHAVAFDNLVAFEGKPKEPPGPRAMLWYVLVVILMSAFFAARKPSEEKVDVGAAESLRSLTNLAHNGFRLIAAAALVLVVAIGLQVFTTINAPEYLFLGAFLAFLVDRFMKKRLMGIIAVTWFFVSLGLYWGLGFSFEKFFAMLVFFEVAHLMLKHLSTAADRIRPFYTTPPKGPRPYSERVVMVVLKPFLF